MLKFTSIQDLLDSLNITKEQIRKQVYSAASIACKGVDREFERFFKLPEQGLTYEQKKAIYENNPLYQAIKPLCKHPDDQIGFAYAWAFGGKNYKALALCRHESEYPFVLALWNECESVGFDLSKLSKDFMDVALSGQDTDIATIAEKVKLLPEVRELFNTSVKYSGKASDYEPSVLRLPVPAIKDFLKLSRESDRILPHYVVRRLTTNYTDQELTYDFMKDIYVHLYSAERPYYMSSRLFDEFNPIDISYNDTRKLIELSQQCKDQLDVLMIKMYDCEERTQHNSWSATVRGILRESVPFDNVLDIGYVVTGLTDIESAQGLRDYLGKFLGKYPEIKVGMPEQRGDVWNCTITQTFTDPKADNHTYEITLHATYYTKRQFTTEITQEYANCFEEVWGDVTLDNVDRTSSLRLHDHVTTVFVKGKCRITVGDGDAAINSSYKVIIKGLTDDAELTLQCGTDGACIGSPAISQSYGRVRFEAYGKVNVVVDNCKLNTSTTDENCAATICNWGQGVGTYEAINGGDITGVQEYGKHIKYIHEVLGGSVTKKEGIFNFVIDNNPKVQEEARLDAELQAQVLDMIPPSQLDQYGETPEERAYNFYKEHKGWFKK